MRSSRDRVMAWIGAAALASLVACGGGGSSGEAGGAPAAASATTASPDPIDAGSDAAWTSLAERPCPQGSTLTYEDFGAPFFLTYCEGCHSTAMPEGSRQNAPIAVNFNTLDDVRAHKDRIWARAADTNATMPPSGGPSTKDRALLGEWLACGAP